MGLTSRKCAVPLADMESPLDPASIHSPTVDVDAPGIVSVDTLNPFDKTEVLVTGSAYFLPDTGVASPLAMIYGAVSTLFEKKVARLILKPE